MKSLQPFNLKAQKMEAIRTAETGDVQALQEPAKSGRVYYPLGCTLSFSPGWEVDVSAVPPDSANPSNAIFLIVTSVVHGRRKCPTTSVTIPPGPTSVAPR